MRLFTHASQLCTVSALQEIEFGIRQDEMLIKALKLLHEQAEGKEKVGIGKIS